MTRLRMIVGEAWRSITASMSTTVAATMTVLVAMLVLGTTIGLGTWVLSYSDLTATSPGYHLFLAHQVAKEVMATIGSAAAVVTAGTGGAGSLTLGV